MFRWAIIFAVIALVAALLGFGGIAGLSAEFAKFLLVIAAVLFVVALLFGRGRRTLPYPRMPKPLPRPAAVRGCRHAFLKDRTPASRLAFIRPRQRYPW